jgi:hypothetical protein
MTSQQKDAVTNKIMIYITVAFAGTVVWYLMFCMLKSSLYLTANILLVILALLGIAMGVIFFRMAKTRKGNFKGYGWMSLIIAALSLFMNVGYFCNLIGIDLTSAWEFLSNDVLRSQVTLIVSYIILAVAIIWNVVLIMKKPDKTKASAKNK